MDFNRRRPRHDWPGFGFKSFFALITTFVIFGFVMVFGAIIYTVVDNMKHPCIKYQQQPCEIQECVNRGYKDHCLEWRTYPGTCPVCVERKP